MKKFLIFILTLFISHVAFGATTPNSVVTAQTPTLGVVQFLQGTDVAGTYKTLYTGNANGSKIVAIYATNNDPSATHLTTCQVVTGGVKYGGIAITPPVSSGFANAVPAVNMMLSTNWPGLPVDSDGDSYIYLPSASYTIQCTFATALTASDVINLVAVGADF